MSNLRQFWLALLLLGLGFGPLAMQALESHGCCCTSQVASAQCHCQDEPDSRSHCGLDCAPENPIAILQSVTSYPQKKILAIAFCQRLVTILVTLTDPGDARLGVAAGWVLPSSPPLLASHLDLPPPTLLLV